VDRSLSASSARAGHTSTVASNGIGQRRARFVRPGEAKAPECRSSALHFPSVVVDTDVSPATPSTSYRKARHMSDLGLQEVFGLLWPDFAALFRGELAGVTALIVIVLFVISGWFLWFAVRERRRALRRIGQIQLMLDGVATDELIARRPELRRLFTIEGVAAAGSRRLRGAIGRCSW